MKSSIVAAAIVAIALIAMTGCSQPDKEPAPCVPQCTDAVCGDDGCGGTCGTCPDGEACSEGACTTCGNGELDEGETCDPSADVSCAREEWCVAEDGCFTAEYVGSEATCDAECITMQIVACVNDDDCCPAGCNPGNDVDCASEDCGNGQLDPGETCDDPEVPCPTDCAPTHACESAEFRGFAAACTLTCVREEITACLPDADGCCPAGCSDVNDADCNPAVCGDGDVTGQETCDSGIQWPAPGSCSPACEDNRSCTVDLMNGTVAACDVQCTHAAATDCVSGDDCCPAGCEGTDADCEDVVCGDGNVDGSEQCDSAIPADEPGACPANDSDCDDFDACTTDSMTGDAADCSAQCVNTPPPCVDGDGCCSPACTADNDDDCAALDLCELYCFSALTYCSGQHELYESQGECENACEQMPIGIPGAESGDSVYCRIHHLDDAETDPEGHCIHGAEVPLDGCI